MQSGEGSGKDLRQALGLSRAAESDEEAAAGGVEARGAVEEVNVGGPREGGAQSALEHGVGTHLHHSLGGLPSPQVRQSGLQIDAVPSPPAPEIGAKVRGKPTGRGDQ